VSAPHQLREVLRRLGLSGMLDTFEARLSQAEAGDLGHLEFIQILCQDELARRDAAAVARRIRQARFEFEATFENFDFAFNPALPAARLRDLAGLHFLTEHQSVVLYGPVGVGKSHVAQALGHAGCRAGHTALFIKTSRLLADLAGGHADRSWPIRMRKLAKVDLLILDDFAVREFTAAQADDLYELVSERERRGSMILTSNRQPVDWYPLFPNPVVAESLLDRLVNASHLVLMDGKSYRPSRRPKALDGDATSTEPKATRKQPTVDPPADNTNSDPSAQQPVEEPTQDPTAVA
jgi:DNA replication protein DnaC